MDSKQVAFCTYFDRGFLLKGLALHSSLIRHNPDAKLWILTFDVYTERILTKMKLKGVTIISLKDFEDKDLLSVKPTRNKVEYIWTTTPSLPLYVFKKNPTIKYAVYLDADLYFYSNAMVGVTEIGNGSILAVPHRFPKGLEHLAKDSGYFNVAFNVFENDKTGVECLKRWRNQCLEWCYWKHENGKLGDQMYLDEWPKVYGNKLTISKNIGVDTAPWNVYQYKVSKKNDFTYINSIKLSCYHFHQFQILGPSNFSRVLGYTLSKDVAHNIYEPYEEELAKQFKIVKKYDSRFEIKKPDSSGNRVQLLRQKLARHFGPFYWRLTSMIENLKNRI